MLKRLARDKRGVSAVEFALIAPIMILIYFGLAELTMSMMAERRSSHTAAAIADLVAQSTQINNSEMTAVFKIGEAIMKPFPTSTLKMRVTSVKADASGTPKVVWSQGKGMGALAAGANVSGFPTGLIAAHESVIMTETTYAFSSPVKQVLPNAMNFSETFYLRPRKSVEVTWVN